LRVLEMEGRESLRFSASNPALLQGGVLSDNRNHIRVAEGLAAQSALEGLSKWLAVVSQDDLEEIRERKKWNNAYLLRNNPKHVLNDLLTSNVHQKLTKSDYQYEILGNNSEGGPKEVALRIPVLEPILDKANLAFTGIGETVKDAKWEAARKAIQELKPLLREVKKRRFKKPEYPESGAEEGALGAGEQITESPEKFVKLERDDKSLPLNQRLNRVADNLVEEITWMFASQDKNIGEIQVTLDNFRMRMMLLALARLPERLRCSAELVVQGELESEQQRQRRRQAQKQQLLRLQSQKLKPLTRFALRVSRDTPVAESDSDPFMVDSSNTDPAKLAPMLKQAFEEGMRDPTGAGSNLDGTVIELQFAGDGTGGPSSNAGKAIRFLQLAFLREKKQVRFSVRFTDITDEDGYTKPGMTVALTLS